MREGWRDESRGRLKSRPWKTNEGRHILRANCNGERCFDSDHGPKAFLARLDISYAYEDWASCRLRLASQSISRSPIGLTIELLKGPSRATAQSVVDDTFQCEPKDVESLVDYLRSKRAEVYRRLDVEQKVSVFLPQGDPPIMQVTRDESRPAFFTLGELTRWRFLRHFPAYPLKAHQTKGVEWLRSHKSAILADDMGLGKTLQAIAAFEQMHRAAEVENLLIVCPKSLIGVWETEISLWAPRLCTVALHTGVSRKTWGVLASQCQVAITNYEAIRASGPSAQGFDVLILDEVHKLKNSKSLNYSACYNLQPKVTWGLSGTPLENKPSDLTAILHLLDRKRISLSDERLPIASLRSVASGYILRRDKRAIADELPQVLEKLDLVPLTPEQRHRYEEVLRDGRSYATVGGWISAFSRLRDLCDFDPRTGASSKIERTLVILDSVFRRGEKAVVFSWRIEPLRLLKERIAARWEGNTAEIITGQTSSTKRSNIVTSFQNLGQPRVLLCSMRATAEGLTLTAANHVVFLNEWWNPAVNSQARDRVNRIGQSKDVFVYLLRTAGTVETQLADILEAKSELFDEIVNRLTRRHSADEAVPKELSKFLSGEVR